jgi:hypothetical protein
MNVVLIIIYLFYNLNVNLVDVGLIGLQNLMIILTTLVGDLIFLIGVVLLVLHF